MEIIEKTENQTVFKAKITEELANAIRRYLNRVMVLAVDEVEIIKNDSPLYDETLAHRIGLVPLKAKSYNEKTSEELKLSSKKEGYVYSGELSGNIEVVYPNIPLTFLNKGQAIELVAKVRAGKGIEHTKFSPGIMFYRHVSEITLDKEFKEKVKELCPDAEIKEKGEKIIVIDDKKKDICDLCEGIAEENEKKADVKLTDELIITLESFGQLSEKEIIQKAISELKNDLKEFSKTLK